MKLLRSIRLGLLLLACLAAWCELMHAQQQEQENAPAAPAPAVSAPALSASPDADTASADVSNTAGGAMLTPPPVSGQSYPLAPSSEDRANYLRGGVTFTTAYSDNVLASTSGTPVSDVSYSVWPTIALDETTTRLHTTLTYAPGFTVYQHTSAFNQADQNLSADARYRLSPHVTVSIRDSFQKTSNVFNSPAQGLDVSVTGSAAAPNVSIVAPLADQLNNTGNIGIAYQFAANSMVGASGTFSNLHFPNPSQVPGLFDSASRAGSAFYAQRVSARHYFGAAYQYQELLSYPGALTNQTQTHSVYGFYTFLPNPRLSFSLFGGPQYYNSGAQVVSLGAPLLPAMTTWNGAGGTSVNWQLQRTSIAASYLHTINGGSGLISAVKLDSATASVRQQITRNIGGSLAGSYANNGTITVASLGGHTISASAALQRMIGQHINAQAGYTRLHQTYDFFSANPNTNREWVSISYQFARPLGR
jgi:hypothetical protein